MAILIPEINLTPEQQLKQIKHELELIKDLEYKKLSFKISAESFVSPLHHRSIKFMEDILEHPEFYEELLEPMKDTKYKFLIIPGEQIPIEVQNLPGSKNMEDRSAYEFIKYTIEYRPDLTSYFIIDDKLKRYVGFISYQVAKNKEDIPFINGIKVLRFDDDGDLRNDVIKLFNDLTLDYPEVYWSAVCDKENPVLKPYKIIFEKKKREGFLTGYKEIYIKKCKISCYSVKWNLD